jgi:hypothetical protein
MHSTKITHKILAKKKRQNNFPSDNSKKQKYFENLANHSPGSESIGTLTVTLPIRQKKPVSTTFDIQ